MKKLILPAVILTAAPALAAIDCATIPSCSSLGYSETAGACKGKYLTCPFDNTKIACLDSPKVGDLKYSLYSSNHDGWIKCDGTQYSTSTYSKLYSVIGSNFCRKYTSKSAYTSSACSSGMFAVPDYRGFFLRGISYPSTTSSYSSYSNSWNYSTTSPQKQGLPNIVGYGGPLDNSMYPSSAFYKYSSNQHGIKGDDDNPLLGFDASRSNSIYGAQSGVIPGNYAA